MNRDRVVALRISTQDRDLIKMAAKAADVSMSEFVRRAVAKHAWERVTEPG